MPVTWRACWSREQCAPRERALREGSQRAGQRTPTRQRRSLRTPPTYLLDNLTITQRLPQGAALLMETRVSTMCSELGNSRVSTSPDDSGQALVLLPGRYPGTSQRAHLDLPEADGDGSSGGETFDHRAGDEIQQEPWPAEREY